MKHAYSITVCFKTKKPLPQEVLDAIADTMEVQLEALEDGSFDTTILDAPELENGDDYLTLDDDPKTLEYKYGSVETTARKHK